MLKNMAIVTFAGYLELAVGLLSGIVIARTLGPAEYGHYAYGVWLCGMLVLFINSALTSSSIKFIAEARGAGNDSLASALLAQFKQWQTLTTTLTLLGFLAYLWLQKPEELHQSAYGWMVGLTLVAAWSRSSFWLLGAFGKGYEAFVPENIALAATAILNMVVTLFLAVRGATMLEFFSVYTALGVVSFVMVRVMLARSGIAAKKGPIPPEFRQRVVRHVVLTSVLILFGALSNRAVEMTLLKAHASSESVAYFAIAGSLSKGAVDLFAAGLAAVLLPSMSRQFGVGGARSLSNILVESTRLYWFMGLIVAGMGCSVAGSVIQVLYGNKYLQAIPALNWQLAISGLLMMNGAAVAAMTAEDRQLDRILIAGAALALNAVLGYLLIEPLGLSGAIMSSVATQVFTSILIWMLTLKRTHAKLKFRQMGSLLLSALLATLVSSAIARLSPWTWAFVPACGLFMVVYLTASVRFGAWQASDFQLFASLFERLGGFGASLSPKILALGSKYGAAP